MSAEFSTGVTKHGYSIREVCESLGVSKGFMNREIKRGKLGVRRLGRRIIVLEEDLRTYLEQARTGEHVHERPEMKGAKEDWK